MLDLLLVLTPIALLDSASMIPLGIVMLAVLLAGSRPASKSTALLMGITSAYLACGLLLLFGLQSIFDEISTYTLRIWENPETEELVFQVLVGIILCAFGARIATARKRRTKEPVTSDISIRQAMVSGVVVTVTGLPGALPYFAAIDLILRSEIPLIQQTLALGYYNAVFVLPMVALLIFCVIIGERSRSILSAISHFIDRWGQKFIVVLLLALGLTLIADGIGWLLGYPVLPI